MEKKKKAETVATGKLSQFKGWEKFGFFAFVFNLHFCFSVIVCYLQWCFACSHSIYKWSTEYSIRMDEAGPSAISLPVEQ